MGSESVIVLDTYIWIWWANQSKEFRLLCRNIINLHASAGLGVSVISCWEVAKLVEKGRLKLDRSAGEWIESALRLPNVILLPLTAEIAIESSQLPAPIHADPADQMIVATARICGAPMLTAGARLISYPRVATL